MRALLLSVACVAAISSVADRAAAEPVVTGWVALPEGKGSVVQAPSSRILYLNRCAGGCTITPGFDDSRANTSSIVRQTSFLAEYPGGDALWDRTVACVRTLYAGFDIEVTDVDPGSEPHFEAIVAGHPTDVGMGANVGGVSPFECGVIDNAITFTFAGRLDSGPQRTCEIIGQESAHAFGLDHELECQDPLTYQTGCGNKCFQDLAAPCGESATRECACGGDTQNSVAILGELFGKRSSQAVVEILEPAAGAELSSGFFIRADTTVPCLAGIEAFIDGESVGSARSWPYVFNTPPLLPLGDHEIRLVAQDHAGDQVETVIAISVITAIEPPGGSGPCVGCEGPGQPPRGGGCSTGGRGNGHAGLLVLLALLALVRRSRS